MTARELAENCVKYYECTCDVCLTRIESAILQAESDAKEQAVAEERERCAKVAEAVEGDCIDHRTGRNMDWCRGHEAAKEFIAKTIRESP